MGLVVVLSEQRVVPLSRPLLGADHILGRGQLTHRNKRQRSPKPTGNPGTAKANEVVPTFQPDADPARREIPQSVSPGPAKGHAQPTLQRATGARSRPQTRGSLDGALERAPRQVTVSLIP